ncbi:MAG TPA: hypothetical protein VGU90_13555 [Terriglobales bacterium]|jgi:hypothetical protein|nr:hypothetical protein [Terriglobales bacterium]
MESAANPDVRRLCKAVSEEEDSARAQNLLKQLLELLEERQLVACLL